MAYLVLVRHGESTYNAQGLWAGWTDVPLTEKGIQEAIYTGEALKDLHFDIAYTSKLIRAKQTLDEIKKILNINSIPTIEDTALNERNYGDFANQNKWEVKEKLGDEKFQKLRRSWDYPIPNGESLKEVFNRVVPFYKEQILNQLINGKNVLASAHGNSLRALVKYLENINDGEISKLEIGIGEAYVYNIDSNGNIISKEIRAQNPNKGKI